MSQNFVQSFEHLEERPQADKALDRLKRVASLVKPIMRKRGWILPVLGEFFPDEPSLLGLNINRGQKILLRLRPYHSPDSFLPLEDVIGTMLHELTHNVHGPHDEKFYKYLDLLQDEYDELQRSGYAGEGFHTPGRRLGENISHNVPQHVARIRALEAAEKRIKTSSILSGGGRRLGGQSKPSGLSPRELAARAVERRTRDDRVCGSGGSDTRPDREQPEGANASSSTSSAIIDLTLSDDEKSDRSAIPHTSSSETAKKASLIPPVDSRLSGVGSSRLVPRGKQTSTIGKPKRISQKPYPSSSKSAVTVGEAWACNACTLLNKSQSLKCEVCETVRPSMTISPNTWDCLYCGQLGITHDLWTCTLCGQVKLRS